MFYLEQILGGQPVEPSIFSISFALKNKTKNHML